MSRNAMSSTVLAGFADGNAVPVATTGAAAPVVAAVLSSSDTAPTLPAREEEPTCDALCVRDSSSRDETETRAVGGGTRRPLRPWQRMRGGGGSQSHDMGSDNRSFGGKSKRKSPNPSRGDYSGRGPTAVSSASTHPTGTRYHSSSAMLFIDSPLPAPNDPARRSQEQEPQQPHSSPQTPYLQRPVLTIFTMDDEDAEDSHGRAADAHDVAAFPAQSGNPSAFANGVRSDSQDNIDRILQVTETSLLPVDHYSLFGNGLEPSFATSATQSANSLRPVGSLPSLSDHYSRPPQATPPESPGVPPSFASTGRLSSFDRSAPAATRVSATPVVPIAPYNETATRRKLVQDLVSRYGPNAPKIVEEPIDPQPPSTTAVPPSGSGKAKDAEKKRRQTAKEETKLAKKQQPQSKSAPVPASPTAKAAPPTREQVIRVGATRLHQRLSALHLAVYRVKNDGNCQFRAIAYQLLGSEDYHDLIRAHIVSYMRKVRREKFDFYFDSVAAADGYFAKLAKIGSWGDELSLRGASDALYINIHILSSSERNCYSCYQPSDDAPPAPSFLVDVAKIKECRRRERQYKRWQRKSFSQLHGSMISTNTDHSRTVSSTAASYWDPHATTAAAAGPALSHASQDTHLHTGSDLSATYPNMATSAATAAPTGMLLTPLNSTLGDTTSALPHPSLADLSDSSDDSEEAEAARKDDEQVDASALQRALQRKLAKTCIKTSVPFFTPDGQLHHPIRRAATHTNSICRSPQPYSVSGDSHSFRVTSTASNTTMTPVGAGAPLLVPQGAATFGPDVTADCTGPDGCVVTEKKIMGLASFGVTANDPVNVARYQTLEKPPSRLLHPAVEDTAATTTTTTTTPTTTATTALLAPQQQQQQQQQSTSQSFPIFPTRDGGNVMLLASSTRSHRQRPADDGGQRWSSHRDGANARLAVNQSFTALRSTYTNNSGGGGDAGSPHSQSFAYQPTSHSWLSNSVENNASSVAESSRAAYSDDDDTNNGDEVIFVLAPRTEPIDVFLSYLYPVHYNALCVIEPSDDDEVKSSNTNRDNRASDGNAPLQQRQSSQHSFAGEGKPQFINASFLRSSAPL